MKISKLFHWLYAILMLLPFAFFVPSVFYYAFNDNAAMQSVEVPQTETIAVDFNQQKNVCYIAAPSLVTNNNDVSYVIDGTTSGRTHLLNTNYIELTSGHKYLVNGISNLTLHSPDWSFTITSDGITTASRSYTIGLNLEVMSAYTFDNVVVYVMVFDLTQMYGAGNEPTYQEFINQFPNSYYPYTESELMQITYDTGEIEQLVSNTDIINYAWESIWDLPLFSWTKVTFVSVPFSYLTGIFGIGASNSLNYVFGYFVTISIVWLVFDLLLYVPMLAHNWIDKARIE